MNNLKTSRNRKNIRRRGAMLVLVASMLAVLFGMCAFSVDIGQIAAVNSKLSVAADAAALAAAGTLSESTEYSDVKSVAIEYAQNNVPETYGNIADEDSVTIGTWDPDTKTFSSGGVEPNAVRIVVERSEARGNSIPLYFARVLGADTQDVSAEAIAVGPVSTGTSSYSHSVYVTSTKDLSNVVLEFADGEHQKFEDLSGYSGTFSGTGEHENKELLGVWIKSGRNSSGDGPGYGERIDNPGDSTTVHGENEHRGPIPHVTATFESTGAEFSETGSAGPVRLVK